MFCNSKNNLLKSHAPPDNYIIQKCASARLGIQLSVWEAVPECALASTNSISLAIHCMISQTIKQTLFLSLLTKHRLNLQKVQLSQGCVASLLPLLQRAVCLAVIF